MKLKNLILKNFRAYKDEIRIPFENLTTFVGKNDVGKSTILEALEVFFNNEIVKIDAHDLCKDCEDKQVVIGCEFVDFPSELVLDASAKTNLKSEYLLNANGNLEIHKIYDCSGKTPKESIYVFANHPSADKANDLLLLKNTDLKTRLAEFGIAGEGIDLRKNPEIRKSIWTSDIDLNLLDQLIPLDAAGGDLKKIWDSLGKYMPIFALFQADRPSKDDDTEVQDPMKIAIQEAIKSAQVELERVKKLVRDHATEVAKRTLEKLEEMDASLAKELSPHFRTEPKWDSIFKLSLTGDGQIPINKRGSGVRRLILINFFRAEAERRKRDSTAPSIIFAIEEPETSQHPNNQRMLIKALLQLSEQENTQIVLTTHVPGLAALVPVESLRFIERTSGKNSVRYGDDAVYREVADSLGVIHDARYPAQVMVCVEGKYDISFLKLVSKKLASKNSSIPDLTSDQRIVLYPLNGNNLQTWVQNHYLKNTGLPEVHIYDRGLQPYKFESACTVVNSRGDNSFACLTGKREIENYLHPDAVNEKIGINITFGADDDVPAMVAEAIHTLAFDRGETQQRWADLPDEKKKEKENLCKRRLNGEVIEHMTIEQIEVIDDKKDIQTWLSEIASRLRD